MLSVEKIYCSESRKSLSQQLLFDAILSRFHFASELHHLGCYYNEYPYSEANSILILEVAFEKRIIYSVFLLFWKDKFLLIFGLFISEYLDQVPS